ncbi:MAG: B12-binding domain-containing radical SAM protein [Candidatus Omnitrophica bacterium]|nr:B12-binding domain-containing radical SAM protein [Candidatus Omnitrophota bacterium]
MLNVLLISLQENLCTFGIRYIFHSVRKAGHNPFLLYPNLKDGIVDDAAYTVFQEEADRFLKGKSVDIVGISFMSYQNPIVRKMAKHIKEYHASVVTVGGGIHVTAYPEDSLEYLDAVCVGEGEISFNKFLDEFSERKDLERIDVPGIFTQASLRRGDARELPFLDDLDMLEVLPVLDEPAYVFAGGKIRPLSVNMLGKYHRYNGNSYDITTSRGCPLNCSYCADNIFQGLYGSKWKKVRVRSVDHVMAELRGAVRARPTISFINFHDDTFLSRPRAWLEEFALKYKAEIKLPLMFRTIPGSFVTEKLGTLSGLDIISAGIGLQSGSFRVLKEIYSRPIKTEVFADSIAAFNARKIIPVIDVMLNNPYEKKEDILESVRLLASIKKPYLLELYGFTFYPGTEMTVRALHDGIIGESDTVRTQAYVEKNDEKSYLNNVIFVAPHFPKGFIYFLVRREKTRMVRALFPFVVFAGSFLNLFTFLRMISRAHGHNPIKSGRFLYRTLDIVISVYHVLPFLRHLTPARKNSDG